MAANSRVVPLPTEFVTRHLMGVAGSVRHLDELVDVRSLGEALKHHRDACHVGASVQDAAEHLLRALCAPAAFHSLDASDVSELLEQGLLEFARLNNCMFDWNSSPAIDGLNAIIDTSLRGEGVVASSRLWVRAHLLPLDEGQSWDWGERHIPGTLELHAVVLGPMTSLTPTEKLHFAALARASCDELAAHGFAVHCPVVNPNVGIPDEEIAAIDLEALGRACLIVALMGRPAHGVSTAIARAGTRPPVLILGPPRTDLSPLNALIEDPVLLSAETKSEVRSRIVQFLNENFDRIESQANAATRRREEVRPRYERFKVAVRLEDELGIDVAGQSLSGSLKRMLSSSPEAFLSAVALSDDLTAYVECAESAIDACTPTDSPEDPAGPALAGQTAIAGPSNRSLPTHQRRVPGSNSVAAMSADNVAPSPFTFRGPDPVLTNDGPTDSWMPRPGQPISESEQLALFGIAAPSRAAVPRQKRPGHWRDVPALSPREFAASIKAFDRTSCDAEEAERVIDYVAGIRCDQQLLAASGGGVSHLPLDQVSHWIRVIEDLRSQG